MADVVTAAVAPNPAKALADFQERMAQRIRDSFGDLMPDEVIQAMIAKELERCFFEPRREPNPNRGAWNAPDVIHVESVFREECGKALRPIMVAAVARWVAAHEAEIHEKVEALLKPDLLLILATHAVMAQVSKATDKIVSLETRLDLALQHLGIHGRI
jgi:hypothetical protein